MWIRATLPRPCQEMDPKNFGWSLTDSIYEPIWYAGPMLPTTIRVDESEDGEDEDHEIGPDVMQDVEYEETSDEEEEEEDCE